MHADIHTAPAQVAVPAPAKGGVELVASRLHIPILLINLSFALTLIILS